MWNAYYTLYVQKTREMSKCGYGEKIFPALTKHQTPVICPNTFKKYDFQWHATYEVTLLV